MNKSTIGLYLLIASAIFVGAFFLGRYSIKPTEKGGGESVVEQTLHHRIDSLQNLRNQSDTVIVRIKETKTKIKYEYIQDTIYLSNLPFDSLKARFLSEYPR